MYCKVFLMSLGLQVSEQHDYMNAQNQSLFCAPCQMVLMITRLPCTR
jgi:hypothetical protein